MVTGRRKAKNDQHLHYFMEQEMSPQLIIRLGSLVSRGTLVLYNISLRRLTHLRDCDGEE